MIDHPLAQVALGHTMAQSTVELLALIGPFAILFGLGTFLVINPIVKSQGELYERRGAAGPERPRPDDHHDDQAPRPAAQVTEDHVLAGHRRGVPDHHP